MNTDLNLCNFLSVYHFIVIWSCQAVSYACK